MKQPSLYRNVSFLLTLLLFSRFLSVCAQHDVDSLIQANMRAGDIPGMSVVIIREGQEVIKTFGYADAETGETVTPKTRFELASCTKAFTALAILGLEA